MKAPRIPQSFLLLLICATISFSQTTNPQGKSLSSEDTPRNFKIALIGDQGLGVGAESVLHLIRSEGAQALVHLGDFDYIDSPSAWDNQINNILGENFPYFSVIGNHDLKRWKGADGYQQLIKARFQRLGIDWTGDLGVQSSFRYKGIFFVLVAPGVAGAKHNSFIKDQLTIDDSIWRVAAWHKNMNRMQTGRKKDETGWEVYEEARKGGAIIVTGHEHAYQRTYLLNDISAQAVANTSNEFAISKGKTFVVVSGLGGKGVRQQWIGGDWWASIYARNCLLLDRVCKPNATFGALFGVFNVDGIANKAEFYFKDVANRVIDRFTVFSDLTPKKDLIETTGVDK